MNLYALYSKRLIKSLGNKRTLITLVVMILVIVVISLTITIAPLTPPTRASILRLVKFLGLPPTQSSFAAAFFIVEFPLFLALLSSVLVSMMPQKIISYERTSGNMEILLSMFSSVRKIVLAVLVSTLIGAVAIFLAFTGVGFATILAYGGIYHHFIPLTQSFYIFVFALDSSVTVLAAVISVVFTVSFPTFSSMEVYAMTTSPLQMISYAPALAILLIVTLIPIDPITIVYFTIPIIVVLIAVSIAIAGRRMRRDILVRK